MTSRVHFWSKILFCHISTKNRFEISRDHFLVNFGWKIILSIFWPKIDFWPPGSIFGRKFEFHIFRPKIDLWSLGTILGKFWSKNWTFDFLTKNRFLTPRVHFWSKIWIFGFSTKNLFETLREHFWANFGQKIELLIF